MADSHSSGDYSDVVSRRKFVSLAGATGAAAIAGCLSGDSDGGSDSDWFETNTGSFEVTTFQYNPAVGWNIPHAEYGLFAPWAQYLMGENEWVPHLIEEWNHSDNSLVLTLSEDFTWGESGDSITAEDLALQLRIAENAGDALWDLIDGVEATGEYELTLNYSEDTRPDFVETAALDRRAAFPPSHFEGEEDNESPGEVEVQTPNPSGPVALTETDDNYHRYEPRNQTDEYEDDAVAGDHYNWPGYELGYLQDNNAFHQSFIAGELDGAHSIFTHPDTFSDYPDSVREFQIPGLFGAAIWFDHTDEDMGNRNVRQAMYHSIDRQAIVTTVGESTKVSHHPTPTGLPFNTMEEVFGDVGSDDDFNTYDRDEEQAQSLLEDAGYDGPEDISGTILYPSGWSDWAEAIQSATDQLNDVGWDVTSEGTSDAPGDYAPIMTEEDYNMCAHSHTDGGLRAVMTIPYYSLDYKLRNDQYENADGHFAGYNKEEVEIDGETINIEDAFSALGTAAEGEREEYIRPLARVYNVDVPCIMLFEKFEQSYIDTDGYEIPDESKHFNGVWPMWWLPQVEESLEGYDTPGLMKAKED